MGFQRRTWFRQTAVRTCGFIRTDQLSAIRAKHRSFFSCGHMKNQKIPYQCRNCCSGADWGCDLGRVLQSVFIFSTFSWIGPLTVLPECVLLCRADKRWLIILFLYHVDDRDGKQDFLLICHSLSCPFCLDTRSRLRYFSIRFIRNSCFSGDRLWLLFPLRTCRQRKLRRDGYRYMGRRIIERCLWKVGDPWVQIRIQRLRFSSLLLSRSFESGLDDHRVQSR